MIALPLANAPVFAEANRTPRLSSQSKHLMMGYFTHSNPIHE